MALHISLSHQKLQQRLDHMKRFRKQHEQIRSVIDRVLLQTQKATNVLNDVNAIDEVNTAYESVKEVDALDISKEGQDAWELAMKR
jgi:dynein heavy chain 1